MEGLKPMQPKVVTTGRERPSHQGEIDRHQTAMNTVDYTSSESWELLRQ
jgi:hypothetical protein